MSDTSDNLIVLFDGYCNLCSNTVRFILKFDRKKKFKFASLQSDFIQKTKDKIPPDTDSVIVLHKNQVFTYSASVFKIFKELGFPFYILSYFKYLPKKWTDGIYRWIAKNRYSWFGKKENCFIPDDDFKDRFL